MNQINYHELAWLILFCVAAVIILISVISLCLSQVRGMYELALAQAKSNGVREYGHGLEQQAYWFQGRDHALIIALANQMKSSGYTPFPNMHQLREVGLPGILASMPGYAEAKKLEVEGQ